MHRPVRVLALSAMFQAGAALCASAQAPDRGLDQAVRLWLGDPSLPSAFYQSVADGDQWRLTIPLAGVVRPGVTADKETGSIVAVARKLPDGRWTIQTVSVPAKLGMSRESLEGSRKQRLDLRCESQTGMAVIDPELRLRSRFSAQAHGVVETVADGSRTLTTSFGDVQGKAAWQAIAGAGTQFDQSEHIANTVIQVPAASTTVRFAASRMDQTMTSQDVDVATVTRGHWLPFVLSTALINSLDADFLPATGGRARPSLDQMARAAEISRQLDALGATDIGGTMDGLSLEFGKVTATAGSGSAFLSWGDPGGVAEGKLGFTLDQISVAAKAAGPTLPSMLPRTIAIAFHASGLPARETAEMMRRLVASGGKPGRDVVRDIPVLLDKGPLVIALDTFRMEDGPATLDAHAMLKVIRPQLIEGEGRITVSGLDAFVTRARTDPKLARIVPALLYARGLGNRRDSGAMVWDVTLSGGHVVVNGLNVWPIRQAPGQRPAPVGAPPG